MSVKRVLISVLGGTILLFGIVLLVLPGPAFLVIPLGLAILATEFVWARRWLKRARNMTNKRKAKRTTKALRQSFERRWESWRRNLPRWLAWFRLAPMRPPQPAWRQVGGPPPPVPPRASVDNPQRDPPVKP
ncbi:MAG: hypothetical protein HS113_27895 [Verrucomicrobiales bacterium]|nr:hypothetical protein [Verrucomicrobiales bacterium]